MAVGGGHILDFAKSVNALAPEHNIFEAVSNNNLLNAKNIKPLIAIPTTAGSGAETTQFSVIYVDGKKYSLDHPSIRPSNTIIDPSLAYSVPKLIAASSGIDALSQAIESFWAVRSTPESKAFAKEAIILLRDNLSVAINTSSKDAKNKVSYAAHLAGKAINISRTTAPHALSYGLTAYYNVPHGQAVAITLPTFYLYNSKVTSGSCNGTRGVTHVQEIFNELNVLFQSQNSFQTSKKLFNLIASLGLKTNLADLNVPVQSLDKLVQSVNLNRLANNPRKLSNKDLKFIYSSIF